MVDLNKFQKFNEERNQFSLKTFGSPETRSCKFPLEKLKHELDELLKQPDDTMEWADCMLCFFDAIWRAGYSFENILDFCIEKLEINKNRKWAPDENGNYSHVK